VCAVVVYGVEGLTRSQQGFGEVTFDATPTALGHLVLGKGGQKPCRRPALLVGLGSDIGPNLLNRGQAQFGEQQFDAGSIDGRGALHATPPARTVPSSS